VLLVNHYVNRSKIHGLGVFTHEPITAGSLVWRFDPMFDVEIPVSFIGGFSEEIVQMIWHHAEYLEHLGVFRLGCDGDMFMNHSASPTLIDCGDEMRAAHDLHAGTELTCDYSHVCVLGFLEERPDLAQCTAE
jgi:hypothetical protein